MPTMTTAQAISLLQGRAHALRSARDRASYDMAKRRLGDAITQVRRWFATAGLSEGDASRLGTSIRNATYTHSNQPAPSSRAPAAPVAARTPTSKGGQAPAPRPAARRSGTRIEIDVPSSEDIEEGIEDVVGGAVGLIEAIRQTVTGRIVRSRLMDLWFPRTRFFGPGVRLAAIFIVVTGTAAVVAHLVDKRAKEEAAAARRATREAAAVEAATVAEVVEAVEE
jgi:hypothetical protein